MLKGVLVGLLLTYSLLINSAKGKPQYGSNLFLPQSGPSASAAPPDPNPSAGLPVNDPSSYYPPSNPFLNFPRPPLPYNPYDPYSPSGPPQSSSADGGNLATAIGDEDDDSESSDSLSNNYPYLQQVSSNHYGLPNFLNALGGYMNNPQSLVHASAVSYGSNPQPPLQGLPVPQPYPIQVLPPPYAYGDNSQSYFQGVSASATVGDSNSQSYFQGLPQQVPLDNNPQPVIQGVPSQVPLQGGPPQLVYRLRRSNRLVKMIPPYFIGPQQPPAPSNSPPLSQPPPNLQPFLLVHLPFNPYFPGVIPVPPNVVRPNIDPGDVPVVAKPPGFY